jgi:CRISPR/Cas system-associated exonuclease Cas4 (RecB family)
MKTIRAAEIGAYLYCQRAWWYAQRGYPSSNQAELAAGQVIHQDHGRSVMTAGCLRALSYLLLIVAAVLLGIAIAGKLL